MSQLFCKVGDLAVTVEAELPINLGNVVKIVSAAGHKKFSSYKQIFLWNGVHSANRIIWLLLWILRWINEVI